jgi:YbgC/YbaW family acyl-CoA thioester hydrolase
MPRVFETRFRVRSYELDSLRHVNNAVYLQYFEQARMEALHATGYPLERLFSMGTVPNVVRAEIDFRRPITEGDPVLITTEVEKAGRSSMSIRQRIYLDRDPAVEVADALIVGVWVGTTDGRPVPIPPQLRDAFGVE